MLFLDLLDTILTIGLCCVLVTFILARFSSKSYFHNLELGVYFYATICMILFEFVQYSMFGEYVDLSTTISKCTLATVITFSCFVVSLFYYQKGQDINGIREEILALTDEIDKLKDLAGGKITVLSKRTVYLLEEFKKMQTRLDESEGGIESIIDRLTTLAETVNSIYTEQKQQQNAIMGQLASLEALEKLRTHSKVNSHGSNDLSSDFGNFAETSFENTGNIKPADNDANFTNNFTTDDASDSGVVFSKLKQPSRSIFSFSGFRGKGKNVKPL